MTQKEEQEANAFAMELLMPEKLFLEEIKKLHGKLYSGVNRYRFHSVDGVILTKKEFLIHKLAKKFAVSEAVITTRMINLGILTSV